MGTFLIFFAKVGILLEIAVGVGKLCYFCAILYTYL